MTVSVAVDACGAVGVSCNSVAVSVITAIAAAAARLSSAAAGFDSGASLLTATDVPSPSFENREADEAAAEILPFPQNLV